MVRRGQRSMNTIMRDELWKIRHYERWTTVVPFVSPNEIDAVRHRMKMSGMRFRTEKIVREGRLVGYRIKVME